MKTGVESVLASLIDAGVSACKPVDAAAAMKSPFWEPDWNPEAHVEITLTIAECREIRAFLEKCQSQMNRPRKRTEKALAAIVEHFNRCYPVGTRVILRKDTGEVETSVRYPAQVLSGHSAVAWFDGVSGAYSIEDERVHMLPVT